MTALQYIESCWAYNILKNIDLAKVPKDDSFTLNAFTIKQLLDATPDFFISNAKIWLLIGILFLQAYTGKVRKAESFLAYK